MAKKLVVEKEVELKVPAEKVWEILTKPEWTKQYMFGCEPVTDWKPGSPILWRGSSNGVIYVKGNILKIKPPDLLQYSTFNANSKLPDVPSNYLTVTLRLSQQDGYTRLTASDGDFSKVEEGEKRYQEAVRNWEMVLSKVKELAEKM
jgi:uncharacterized protein YndB with AHSA1/START domain